MSTPKQVIVMRTDLNMRKGKMVAQGAHASLGAARRANMQYDPEFTVYHEWLHGLQTKICVGVPSEVWLRDVYDAAVAAGLPAYLVTDAALTEFDKPTVTCCAIGPCMLEDVDPITGGLKLL